MNPDLFTTATFTTGAVASALGVTTPRMTNWIRDGFLLASPTAGGWRRLNFADALTCGIAVSLIEAGMSVPAAGMPAREARTWLEQLCTDCSEIAGVSRDPVAWLAENGIQLGARVREHSRHEVECIVWVESAKNPSPPVGMGISPVTLTLPLAMLVKRLVAVLTPITEVTNDE
ncbi:hypothetical protein C8P66_11321 [Humitalea rosea]|uniref:Uncharacterized protein n=1 Tax=Humitalea rosea TaxID=990373 RepID=A0A2W7IDN2_9PROT|nr:hypothetical protein [Humitalea rosea]PZW44854.1 hypothetical protein C8P66_11321 [Humitalea rosea]